MIEIRVGPKGHPLGGGALERKPHHVKWAIKCSKKSLIGLFCMNGVNVLGKKGDIWKEVIIIKFGLKNGDGVLVK